MNSLALLESMAELSGRMVAAAEANDWPTLVSLESQVAALRERLLADGAETSAPSEAQRARKSELIQRMLEDDRKVREQTEPWLASARRLLSTTSHGRSLRTAYGALAP